MSLFDVSNRQSAIINTFQEILHVSSNGRSNMQFQTPIFYVAGIGWKLILFEDCFAVKLLPSATRDEIVFVYAEFQGAFRSINDAGPRIFWIRRISSSC